MTVLKLLIDDGPDFYYECKKCTNKFWVDVCTEENTIYSEYHKCLIAKCPKCEAT